MTRPNRFLAPLLVSSALVAGCSHGSGGSDTSAPNPLEVAALRTALSAAGVTPAPPAPVVSPELFELGQALFFDRILSGNRDVACATCHLPQFAGADGRTLPGGSHGTGSGPARTGGDIVPRNSPSVLNAHMLQTAFWDSRVQWDGASELQLPFGAMPADERAVLTPGLEILAAQAMLPPTSRAEMRGQPGENEVGDIADTDVEGIWDALTARVLAIPAYQTMLTDAYPGTPLADINFGHVGNAIAAFEAVGFAATDSPLQAFLHGDDTALGNDALQGGLEFFGAAACGACHDGPALGGSGHQNIGMPQFGPGHGDGPSGLDDWGRQAISGNAADRYRFRTPALLNVALTAPYGHLGQFATLRSIVEHYEDPAASLTSYVITDHVSDPALVGTQIASEADVLASLDARLSGTRDFDTDRVLAFLESMTAERALDLSALLPATVPSGLPID